MQCKLPSNNQIFIGVFNNLVPITRVGALRLESEFLSMQCLFVLWTCLASSRHWEVKYRVCNVPWSGRSYHPPRSSQRGLHSCGLCISWMQLMLLYSFPFSFFSWMSLFISPPPLSFYPSPLFPSLLLVPLYFSSPSLYFLSPFLPPPSPYLCRSRILSSMERQKGLSRSSCTNHEGETLSLDVSWTFVTTVPRGLSMAKVHRWRRYVIGLFLSSVTSCLLISVTSYLLIFVISCSLIGVTFWHCLSVAKMCMTWSISQIWALLVNTSNGRQ